MRFVACLAAAGVTLLAASSARADEPMDGTFLASRSCEALVSIRKDTNPGMAFTGPGLSYKLLAKNGRKAGYYRIEMPDADPPERWVRVECGKVLPPAAAAPPPAAAPAAAKGAIRSYVLALSWQPTFCESNPKKPECRWQNGKRYDANHLSLHGLWPQPSNVAYCNVPDGVRAGETARTTLFPFTMDGQRLGVRLQPPRQGEHTADLLAALGYDGAAIEALRAARAVA